MYFVNNRQLINKLEVNTGTELSPSYADMCCATERTLNINLEEQDFDVFCDALRRHVTTGADVQIATTIKIDAQNSAVQKFLGDVHTLLASGTINQFTNVMIKFGLLSGISDSVLTYTNYKATANVTMEALGGNAEDVSEVAITFSLNGKATVDASL